MYMHKWRIADLAASISSRRRTRATHRLASIANLRGVLAARLNSDDDPYVHVT